MKQGFVTQAFKLILASEYLDSRGFAMSRVLNKSLVGEESSAERLMAIRKIVENELTVEHGISVPRDLTEEQRRALINDFEKFYQTALEKLTPWLSRDFDHREKALTEKQIRLAQNSLHIAAKYGYEQAVSKMLTSLPEDKRLQVVNSVDDGDTVLHAGVRSGKVEVVKILLKLYSTKEACLEAVNSVDEDGDTVLHAAIYAEHDNAEVLKIFLGLYPTKESCLEVVLEALNRRDDDGDTVLYAAVRKGYVGKIKTILSYLPEKIRLCRFIEMRFPEGVLAQFVSGEVEKIIEEASQIRSILNAQLHNMAPETEEWTRLESLLFAFVEDVVINLSQEDNKTSDTFIKLCEDRRQNSWLKYLTPETQQTFGFFAKSFSQNDNDAEKLVFDLIEQKKRKEQLRQEEGQPLKKKKI